MAISVSVKDVITDIIESGETPITLHASVGTTSGNRTKTMFKTDNTQYTVPVGKVFQLCAFQIFLDNQCIMQITDSNVLDTTGTLIMPIWYRTDTTSDNTFYTTCYHQVTAGRNITVALPSWTGDALYTAVGYETDA